MNSYDTLTEALNDLKKRGYTYDFNLKNSVLECAALDRLLHPAAFEVDEVYRFEGMTDPDDEAVLYAIRTSDGLHGTLVSAYGAYTDELTEEMAAKLHMPRSGV